MSTREIKTTNGGWVTTAMVLGLVAAFALGVYNGYSYAAAVDCK
jgi:lactobin A/cerein 7B family class IIb bacteriocin